VTNQAKVGIFTFVTIAIFILGFYFLKGTNLFVRKNVYYAVYERVDGLYKSNLIEINGFPIGRVGTMERDPITGKIVVELDLDKNVKVPKSDSTCALLVSTDFLGSKKVKLVFGNSGVYMSDGDTISTLFKKDITEQLGSEIDPIMADVKKMLPGLDSTIGGIKLMFDVNDPRSLYTTLAKVNRAIDGINGILAKNDNTIKLTLDNLQSFTENLKKNNDKITHLLTNVDDLSDSLKQADLKATIENLNGTITQLKAMLADINQGKGTLGKVVKDDQLYNKVDSAIGNLNVLLKDVKARPYRYISINVLGSKKAEKRRALQDNETGK
jgi:phospholipid/cholesterol/gamma-HCH transport system substrate-binding protein